MRSLVVHLVFLLIGTKTLTGFTCPSRTTRRGGVSRRWSLNHDERSDDLSSTTRSSSSSRRILFQQATATTLILLTGRTRSANAIVTDETDKFADNWWTSSTGGGGEDTLTSKVVVPNTPREVSDEIDISVPKDQLLSKGLGLELNEVEFRTNRRVFVKSVQPGSLAESLGIRKNWIVVAVNGQSTERTDVAGVALMVSRAATTAQGNEEGDTSTTMITLRFRDPVVFQNTLRSLENSNGGEVTTQIAPSGDTTQRNADGSVMRGEMIRSQDDQRLTVTQLIPPKSICTRRAQVDDLMEISYIGTVIETGQVFDGSAVKINGQGIPGRANDISIFFVLGKQPFGQFPPGWDVGLEGMCVGERRRLLVPPVLAYGSTGLPRRGIPPNSTLQYDVTLVSLNGLATP